MTNSWSVIAARLGYVQFPGTATEPAKSGLGVAQSIQHLYKEYIAPFEDWCTHSLFLICCPQSITYPF